LNGSPALKKKSIFALISQKAIAVHHLQRKWIVREPREILSQCLGGKPGEAIIWRERVGHGPIEKIGQGG
jgi:hypothetical protein